MNPAIDTPRLIFRALTVDDFDAVHAYASDPVVTRYTAFGPNTVEQTREFLERHRDESSQADRANYNFGLVHKQTNRLIGSCGLLRTDTNGPQYGFGYVLHKDYWRQGLASEATGGTTCRRSRC
jgi:RimJ/RimL family protein N-acetyltransferase